MALEGGVVVKIVYDTAQIFARRPPIDIPPPALRRYDAQLSFKLGRILLRPVVAEIGPPTGAW